MNDELDALLKDCARQPRSPLSAPTVADVWREIDRRRTRSGRPFAGTFAARLLNAFGRGDSVFVDARVAATAVAFAALVGVVPAMVAGHAENERRLARQSIHFEVFSAGAGAFGAPFAGGEASTSRKAPTLAP